MGRGVAGKYKLTPLELENQIEKSTFLLDKNFLDFLVETSVYSRMTFLKSFKYKKFYSANGKKWKELSGFTIKKRRREKTWPGNILEDSGTLKKSILFDRSVENQPPHVFKRKLFTNPDFFNNPKNPHRPMCYAGIHNNPSSSDTYGSGFGGKTAKRVVQRQFIGYSTYIDRFMNENIDKYLFDNVFGRPSLYEASKEIIDD